MVYFRAVFSVYVFTAAALAIVSPFLPRLSSSFLPRSRTLPQILVTISSLYLSSLYWLLKETSTDLGAGGFGTLTFQSTSPTMTESQKRIQATLRVRLLLSYALALQNGRLSLPVLTLSIFPVTLRDHRRFLVDGLLLCLHRNPRRHQADVPHLVQFERSTRRTRPTLRPHHFRRSPLHPPRPPGLRRTPNRRNGTERRRRRCVSEAANDGGGEGEVVGNGGRGAVLSEASGADIVVDVQVERSNGDGRGAEVVLPATRTTG
jgi:hypothetical protein